MAYLAASEINLETSGHGEDREKTPEEIAEERIEAARKSKATELDLVDLGLTELPASIGKLDQLQHLDVQSNGLTGLPKSLHQLTQLQTLWHHREIGSQDELRALLRKHEIEWDEKYVWD